MLISIFTVTNDCNSVEKKDRSTDPVHQNKRNVSYILAFDVAKRQML